MNIKDVQQALTDQGFDTKGVDGIAGPNTYAAVKLFQQAKGLKADGVLRWETLKALLAEVNWASSLAGRALQIAEIMVGVREEQGPNAGVMVDVFLKDVGLGAGYSWCMAFVVWCYDQAATSLGIKSPLVHTGGVLDQLARTSCQVILSSKYNEPQPGDIGILDLGGGEGHTFLVSGSASLTMVFSVEGNTNDDGSREGIGVFDRERTIAKTKAFIRVNQ